MASRSATGGRRAASAHRNIPVIRGPYNFAYLRSTDLAALGLVDGDRIEISSDAGMIPAAVEADAGVKPGVVQMTHGWGMLSGDISYDRDRANNGLLISRDRNLEPINAMPCMSTGLVNIRPVQAAK